MSEHDHHVRIRRLEATVERLEAELRNLRERLGLESDVSAELGRVKDNG